MLALADPNDRRTQEEIAESLGVRPETLCRWKRLPGFGEALWDLTYRNLEAEAGRVSAVLLQNALSGNFRFMRLYFEVLKIVGVQKQSTTCTREHVLSEMEFAKGLRQRLTEAELHALVDQLKQRYGIRTPEDIYETEKIKVSDEVNLKIV